ncbi:MAG: FAD binding domain-containing protein, partial [Pseudomonadota bacterium]
MRYYRPDTLHDAVGWLGDNQPRIAAGCTDLFPATTAPEIAGPVLDITGIRSLHGISHEADHVRIGALTTWTDIVRAPLSPAFDGLKLAAVEVGSAQIQNVGTLVGNVCNASPAADGVPCLLTLDAVVELTSRQGTREMRLADFIKGPRQTDRAPDEIVTALLIPKSATTGQSNFLKLGARRYLVISIAMCAVRLVLAEGRIGHAAVAVGSCSAVAQRLPAAESALIGTAPDTFDIPRTINDDVVQTALSPIDDL